jgi:hypothetical protein
MWAVLINFSKEFTMTDSKNYLIGGADVIVTASVFQNKIDVTITIDVTKLDRDEPEHSAHNLVKYLQPLLPKYLTGQMFWWSKIHRKITVVTGTQARRVIKSSLTKIDDAIGRALIDRMARKAEMQLIFG